jgi:hypothetical protein
LLQATFADFEQNFKKVVVGDEIVPSIAVAYANIARMLSSNMIFSISPETVKTWYEEGWHDAVHQFKEENPSNFSEFDLMEELRNNKWANLLFPSLKILNIGLQLYECGCVIRLSPFSLIVIMPPKLSMIMARMNH